MTAAAIIIGPLPVQRGVAAPAGGTFVADIDASAAKYVNRILRVRFEIYMSDANPLTAAAALVAECVFANKAGTGSLLGAIAGSTNPMNSATAGNLAARAEAADAGFATNTAAITVGGAGTQHILCTVTNNNGGGIPADVTVVPYVTVAGSV